MASPKNAKEFLMSPQGVQVVLIATALIGGYLIYTKAKTEAAKIATGVDVTNPQNFANRAFEAMGKQMTGDPNFTLTNQVLKWFPSLRSDAEKKFSESMRNTK